MAHELADIKKLRNKLGITQSELAVRAGVSQSLIAKIEAGALDPGYSKTTQIFESLEEMTRKEELSAAQVMNKHLVTVAGGENVHAIIKKMKKYAISQVPVVEKGKPIGLVTESVLLDRVSSGDDISHLHARDIMEDCPPIITPQTRVSVVAHLLHHFTIVLVAEKGALLGLVSKADLIERIV